MTNENAPPSDTRGPPHGRNKRISALSEEPGRAADSVDNKSKEKSKMKNENIGRTTFLYYSLACSLIVNRNILYLFLVVSSQRLVTTQEMQYLLLHLLPFTQTNFTLLIGTADPYI